MIKYISSTNIRDFLLLNNRINLKVQSDSVDRNSNENRLIRYKRIQFFKNKKNNSREKLLH